MCMTQMPVDVLHSPDHAHGSNPSNLTHGAIPRHQHLGLTTCAVGQPKLTDLSGGRCCGDEELVVVVHSCTKTLVGPRVQKVL